MEKVVPNRYALRLHPTCFPGRMTGSHAKRKRDKE